MIKFFVVGWWNFFNTNMEKKRKEVERIMNIYLLLV